MAGLSGNANLVASSTNYVINVVVTVPALLFIDRMVRRLPLVFEGCSLAVWWFAIAALIATHSKPALGRRQQHAGRKLADIRPSLQTRHCLLIPRRGLLRAYLASCLMDLPTGAIPPSPP